MRTFATYLYYIMATACCVLCPASLWAQEPQAEAPAEAPAATGTDTVPGFRISTYGQDTYEDLDVQLPMDAPSPENVKSVVDYDPVSGFGWFPRAIFNRGQATVADIYAYMSNVQTLLKSRVNSASAETKAHYELLLRTIELGLK